MTTSQLLQFPAQLDLLHLLLIAAVVFVGLLSWRLTLAKQSPVSSDDSAKISSADNTANQDLAPDHASALQLLSLLQERGRFIDFMQEDIVAFSDAEVGAVARVVHSGSQKVLQEYFDIEPIRQEAEESNVEIAEGFDSSEIRLTGNLVGQAPFSGVLVHQGWRASKVNLPSRVAGSVSGSSSLSVLAPAEVELS